MDENGVRPNCDALGLVKCKHVVRSEHSDYNEVRVPMFKNIDGVTLMPVIFDNGCIAEPICKEKDGNSIKCNCKL